MTSSIRRYEVPVDDDWHRLPVSTPVLHVGCRQTEIVEFWAIHRDQGDDTLSESRWFIVCGTGHPLPDGAEYVGTAVAPGGQLVWHLMERQTKGY